MLDEVPCCQNIMYFNVSSHKCICIAWSLFSLDEMDWYGVKHYNIQPEMSILSHTDLPRKNNTEKKLKVFIMNDMNVMTMT